MKRAIQSMVQGVLDGMQLPKAEGFMTALLGPGSKPTGNGRRSFEVLVGDMPLTFAWEPRCSCCKLLRGDSGDPDHTDGPLVWREITSMLLQMLTPAEIHRRVAEMTSGWPKDHRPSYESVLEHCKRHLPVELQIRSQVAAQAMQTFNAKSLAGMTSVGLMYFSNRVALQLGAEAVMRGELRPRTIQDLRVLAEIGLTLERDYLGSSAEASEWLAFAYKMDQAIADVLPKEWKERVQARFRELERQGDRLRERVRAAGAEAAAPGEGILDKALKSLPPPGPEGASGASDGDQGSPSPGGGGEPAGVTGPRAAEGERRGIPPSQAGITHGPPSGEDPPSGGFPPGRSPDGGVPEREEEDEEEDLPRIDTDPAGDEMYWVDGDWLGAD
jgi:hypothetical protein